MPSADDLIRILSLQPHPKEGGFFRETFRSEESFAAELLSDRYGSARSIHTAIYYLLKTGTFSALHRLQSDEIFHFYLGGPVRMLQLFHDGHGETLLLGSDPTRGQSPQVVVPRGVWQGTMLEPGSDYALLGCTVAPGFAYEDYEHGDRDRLVNEYPQWREMIDKLT